MTDDPGWRDFPVAGVILWAGIMGALILALVEWLA
jgi:hypothetical protein